MAFRNGIADYWPEKETLCTSKKHPIGTALHEPAGPVSIAEQKMAPNLLQRAGQAVALSAIANWVGLIVSFLSMVVIARLLTPEDYGCFVMALVTISIPEIVSSGTLGDSLIQKKELRPGHINSVFLQSMGLSLAFWLLLILLSPLIANGFNNPNMTSVLIVTGVILPIGAMMVVPTAMLRRELRYKEITIIDVAGIVGAAAAGVILAVVLRNEWALVGMEVTRRTIRMIGFNYYARWVPATSCTWSDFRELLNFNVANGASKIFQTFESVLPKTLIGVTLGAHAVGLFNLADRLFMQVHSALIAPFAAVAMPVASAMQNNRHELHRAMESSIRTSTLLAYPTFTGAIVLAPYAIPLLFGEQWAPVVLIAQLRMLSGLRAPITAIFLGVFRGIGRPDLVVWITLTTIVTTILFLALTYQYGLVAIVLALLGTQAVTFILGTWLIERVVGFSIVRQLLAGISAFIASMFMALAVWLFITFVPTAGHEIASLVAAVLLGSIVYAIGLSCLRPRLALQLFRAIGAGLSGQPREALRNLRKAFAN